MKIIIKIITTCLLVLCMVKINHAQTIVSGTVADAKSGETLIGATVFARESGRGVTTDINGKYEITLESGTYQLIFSYIGYEDLPKAITINSEERLIFDVKMGEGTSILDMVTVTGSQVEKKLTEETVSIDVISPEFIQRKNNISLADVVQRIPGVEVIDGQPNIRSGSGFAYGAGSRVVLLVDGQPLLSADNGDVKWNFIPIENAAQVEIIKGSSSVLYGSAALNGVINVRLARATETPYTSVSMYSGIYNNMQDTSQIWWESPLERPYQTGVYFAHRQKLNPHLGLVLGGNIHFLKGYLKDADEERARFNFDLRYNPPNKEHISYGISGNTMYHSIGNFFLWGNEPTQHYTHITDPIENDRYHTTSIDPWINIFDKYENKHAIKGRYFNVVKLREPGNAPAQIGSLEYRYQRQFDGNLNVTAGTLGQLFYAKSALFARDSTGGLTGQGGLTYAVYGQVDKKFFNKLNSTFGVRWESFEVAGESIAALPVFRFGLNYSASKTDFFRASFGQGYRVPSLAERYIDDDITDGVFIFPNPQLRPESGWSTEFGYKKVIDGGGDKWNGYIDVAAFVMEYKDMTEFYFDLYRPDSLVGEPITLDELFTYLGFKAVNVSRARIAGAELTVFGAGKIGNIPTRIWTGVTYSFPGDMSADTTLVNFGNFMATAARNLTAVDSADVNSILKYRSLHTARLDIETDIKNFTIGAAANYKSFVYNIDDIFEAQGQYGPLVSTVLPAVLEVRDYRAERYGQGDLIVDIRLAYSFENDHRLTFSTNNVFNRDYTLRAAKPGPPRLYNLKYQMIF